MGRLRGRLRSLGGADPDPDLVALTEEDRRYLTSRNDESVPLPPGAERELTPDNPRLRELRDAYASLDLPVVAPSLWNAENIESFLDLRWFRGDSLFMWHYRELPRITALKYFVILQYARGRDALGLLDTLDEDGAFGCWTFDYPGHGRVSRDLLESVLEISFLERELALSARERFSVLDIGAGYGRLAHRMTSAFANLDDYCCVDAVPESTFVSDYYLRHRGATPRARVLRLDELGGRLQPGGFDLAVNIHSFSECAYDAVAWWVDELVRLRVPRLMVTPNEDELLTVEHDRTRRGFGELLDRAGYRLIRREAVLDDPAIRELAQTPADHFHLFALEE